MACNDIITELVIVQSCKMGAFPKKEELFSMQNRCSGIDKAHGICYNRYKKKLQIGQKYAVS